MVIGKSKIKRVIYSVKINSKTLLRKDDIDTKGERDKELLILLFQYWEERQCNGIKSNEIESHKYLFEIL